MSWLGAFFFVGGLLFGALLREAVSLFLGCRVGRHEWVVVQLEPSGRWGSSIPKEEQSRACARCGKTDDRQGRLRAAQERMIAARNGAQAAAEVAYPLPAKIAQEVAV